MCHKKKDIPKDLTDIDLVVFGHSHKYEDKVEENVRWINPGSCGPRRFNQEITMAVMEIDEKGCFEIQRIDIPHVEKAVKVPVQKDCAATIKMVIKGIEQGKSSEQISQKHHLDLEFVQQVSRMYLTHPGIDLDGILDRLQ